MAKSHGRGSYIKGTVRRGCLVGERFTEELFGIGEANVSRAHMETVCYFTQYLYMSLLGDD